MYYDDHTLLYKHTLLCYFLFREDISFFRYQNAIKTLYEADKVFEKTLETKEKKVENFVCNGTSGGDNWSMQLL